MSKHKERWLELAEEWPLPILGWGIVNGADWQTTEDVPFEEMCQDYGGEG